MLCPNCKTELIEVNGRFICSDCGREIPQNEVMTTDWGSSAPVAPGLYEAANLKSTPEDGSMPVTAFESDYSDSKDASGDLSVEEVLQNQIDGVRPQAPVLAIPESQSVEDVLQEQTDETEASITTEPSFAGSGLPDINAIPVPNTETEQKQDAGFYIATTSDIETKPLVTDLPESFPASPTAQPDTTETKPDELDLSEYTEPSVPKTTTAGPKIVPEIRNTPLEIQPSVTSELPEAQKVTLPEAELPAAEIQPEHTPISVISPVLPEEIPQPLAETEAAPAPTEVVKDMFENVPAAPVNDPGLYAQNYDEIPVASQAPQTSAGKGSLPSGESRTNLIVLITGAVLVLLLIIGGTWGYLSLNKRVEVNPAPVVDQTAAWQELQVMDAGFKISFPGQPEKVESTQTIAGIDTAVITQTYTIENINYSASYATVNATADKLPALAEELAKSQGLDLLTKSVGEYYDANAISFTLGNDTAAYQGKIMLKRGTYILIMAGSSDSQTVDYDKFIKSFNFITVVGNGTR